ncbi:hypothetical protein DI383_05595 [Flavobacteriaceae bacterium LYZ1037]|nr:hypothetical protein DI383_05595 [Flavobacteriaceae bacterium LYZ1037]
MIKFFRKIRYNLMETGKTGKYFKYAIGEIVLVVIGILIALSINNWNEDNKLSKQEVIKLKEIAHSLKQTKENIQEARIDDIRWMHYNETILDYIENKKPYDPQLEVCFGSYFWFSRPEIEFSTFEQLKSTGLDLISNDSLRKEIVKIFEKRFQLLHTENNQWNIAFINTTLPIHIKLFRKIFPESWSPSDDEYALPINYTELFDNDEYKNLLAETIALRKFEISYYEIAIKECESLVIAIENEISHF